MHDVQWHMLDAFWGQDYFFQILGPLRFKECDTHRTQGTGFNVPNLTKKRYMRICKSQTTKWTPSLAKICIIGREKYRGVHMSIVVYFQSATNLRNYVHLNNLISLQAALKCPCRYTCMLTSICYCLFAKISEKFCTYMKILTHMSSEQWWIQGATCWNPLLFDDQCF